MDRLEPVYWLPVKKVIDWIGEARCWRVGAATVVAARPKTVAMIEECMLERMGSIEE